MGFWGARPGDGCCWRRELIKSIIDELMKLVVMNRMLSLVDVRCGARARSLRNEDENEEKITIARLEHFCCWRCGGSLRVLVVLFHLCF